MELKLIRQEHEYFTEGTLYIDGEYFCRTLEDPVRKTKIPHETAIPYGDYKVILSYSPKFKRRLPLLINVPQFEGIRIHRGNYTKDTSGCILVGEYIKDGRLWNSTPFEKEIVNRLDGVENIRIKITRE